MERKPQTYTNHARFDPLYHFFLIPVVLLMLIGGIWAVVRDPAAHSFRYLVLTVWLVVLTYRLRTYPLRVQDRVIRLEERLRLAMLLPDGFRQRIPELTESQLIALRFASDAEIAALVERTLNEKLAAKEIKTSIKNWRPDYWRV